MSVFRLVHAFWRIARTRASSVAVLAQANIAANGANVAAQSRSTSSTPRAHLNCMVVKLGRNERNDDGELQSDEMHFNSKERSNELHEKRGE